MVPDDDVADSGRTNNTMNITMSLIAEDKPEVSTLRVRPVIRLSVELITTYRLINKIYYEEKAKKMQESGGRRGGVHNMGYDDGNYDYIIQQDETINSRYIVRRKLGKGSFGQVVLALDRHVGRDVAIKIIKNRRPFRIQAQTEIDILRMIHEKDVSDNSNVVRLLETFEHQKHQCIVFEILSITLYDLLKSRNFEGISLSLARKFCNQLLGTLEFLSRPEVGIIHCDIKPENILLRYPHRSILKVVDFGSSCLATKKTYTYIQSRFYRSPEVLLGLPYGVEIDMWSLGCVMLEMFTGEPIFAGVDQFDQLNRMAEVLGMAPRKMIVASPPTTRIQFFDEVRESASTRSTSSERKMVEDDEDSKLEGVEQPVLERRASNSEGDDIDILEYKFRQIGKSVERPVGSKSLAKVVWAQRTRVRKSTRTAVHSSIEDLDEGSSSSSSAGAASINQAELEDFLSLMSSMLVYDPQQRIKPTQALNHDYMTNRWSSTSSSSSGMGQSSSSSPSSMATSNDLASAGSSSPKAVTALSLAAGLSYSLQSGVVPIPVSININLSGISMMNNSQQMAVELDASVVRNAKSSSSSPSTTSSSISTHLHRTNLREAIRIDTKQQPPSRKHAKLSPSAAGTLSSSSSNQSAKKPLSMSGSSSSAAAGVMTRGKAKSQMAIMQATEFARAKSAVGVDDSHKQQQQSSSEMRISDDDVPVAATTTTRPDKRTIRRLRSSS